MGECLVVANQTLGARRLDELIRERIAAGDLHFHVVVPMTDPRYETGEWVWGYVSGVRLGRAHQRAKLRLEAVLARIEELGGTADGEVGDPDPVQAVESALAGREVDRILISTLPSRLSRWLRMDVPTRVGKLVDVPVLTVEAEETHSDA